MIKINIDMPKSCYECKFCTKNYQFAPPPACCLVSLYCNVVREFVKHSAYEYNVKAYKYAKCPLEECEEE